MCAIASDKQKGKPVETLYRLLCFVAAAAEKLPQSQAAAFSVIILFDNNRKLICRCWLKRETKPFGNTLRRCVPRFATQKPSNFLSRPANCFFQALRFALLNTTSVRKCLFILRACVKSQGAQAPRRMEINYTRNQRRWREMLFCFAFRLREVVLIGAQAKIDSETRQEETSTDATWCSSSLGTELGGETSRSESWKFLFPLLSVVGRANWQFTRSFFFSFRLQRDVRDAERATRPGIKRNYRGRKNGKKSQKKEI